MKPYKYKENITINRIPEFTDEWFEFRKSGLGGSDISAVMGLNGKYRSAINVFYEKIGVKRDGSQSMATVCGHLMEPIIAELWSYVDPSDVDALTAGNINLDAYNNKTPFRQCRDRKGQAVNANYPWLFYSMDREILNGMPMAGGEIAEKGGILELKTAAAHVLRQWESGVPIGYIAQTVHGMIVMEKEYAEIALFDNNRNMPIFYFHLKDMIDNGFVPSMIDTSKRFWYDRVLPAREIAEREGFDNVYSQPTPPEIVKLEPSVEDGEAYLQFMKERYRGDGYHALQGEEHTYRQALKDAVISSVVSLLGKKRDTLKSHLMKELNDSGAMEINFERGDDYLGRYELKKRGESYSPYNYIKKPSKSLLEEVVDKIEPIIDDFVSDNSRW